MLTPEKFKREVACKRPSEMLLGEVIHSLTCRAKNAAEKEKQYHSSKPEYSEEYRAKKREYWGLRTHIIKHTAIYPSEVHYVHRYADKIICYDECISYQEYLRALNDDKEALFAEVPCRERCPSRQIKSVYQKTDYYLFFKIGSYTFHTLSSEQESLKYKHLPHVELKEVFFDGEDVNNLLPVQFCRKVYELFNASGENLF